MTIAGPARRQRCRALQLAIVLGVVLTFTGVVDRNPIPIVVGIIGTGVAVVAYLRECRGVEDES
jgi:hypothetical protein